MAELTLTPNISLEVSVRTIALLLPFSLRGLFAPK